MYLVMLYPLLLQVAHPTVGAGVRDYSNFEQRPWDRLLRTIDYVSLLVYGGREAAPAGHRLREMHKGFRGVRDDGAPYYALEPQAYAWVHATLLDTYVRGYPYFAGRLSDDEIERFYREYRGLGRLIGIRKRDLPEDWSGFREYFDRVVSEVLVRTESVASVLATVRGSVPPPLPIPSAIWRAIRLPASRALWLGGIGLVAPALRERLGVRWNVLDEAQFRTMGITSRALSPLMPSGLRVTGPEHLRWRERAIATGPLGASAAGS